MYGRMLTQGDFQTNFMFVLNSSKDALGRSLQEAENSKLVLIIVSPAGSLQGTNN